MSMAVAANGLKYWHLRSLPFNPLITKKITAQVHARLLGLLHFSTMRWPLLLGSLGLSEDE